MLQKYDRQDFFPERKIAVAIDTACGPDILMIPMPPRPPGVASAAMVLGSMRCFVRFISPNDLLGKLTVVLIFLG